MRLIGISPSPRIPATDVPIGRLPAPFAAAPRSRRRPPPRMQNLSCGRSHPHRWSRPDRECDRLPCYQYVTPEPTSQAEPYRTFFRGIQTNLLPVELSTCAGSTGLSGLFSPTWNGTVPAWIALGTPWTSPREQILHGMPRPVRIGAASAWRVGPRALAASAAYRIFETFQPLRRLRHPLAKAW